MKLQISSILALSIISFSSIGCAESLCAVLALPEHSAMQTVTVRATLHATMHGTYLTQHGCEGSLLLVLPEEIPGYSGPVKTVQDEAFRHFTEARFNYLPDAPTFEATFSGVIETARMGQGFGYYHKQSFWLVMRSVDLGPEREIVTISDPPMEWRRPHVLRRIWHAFVKWF